MSRYIITHLHQTLKSRNDKTSVMVQFFCDDKDPRRRISLNLLRSLMHQILVWDKQLLRYVSDDAMEAHLQKLRDDSIGSDELQDLWCALLTVIQRSRTSQLWLIIDALDEPEPTSRTDVARQLNQFFGSDTVGRLKFFQRTVKTQITTPPIDLSSNSEQADLARTCGLIFGRK